MYCLQALPQILMLRGKLEGMTKLGNLLIDGRIWVYSWPPWSTKKKILEDSREATASHQSSLNNATQNIKCSLTFLSARVLNHLGDIDHTLDITPGHLDRNDSPMTVSCWRPLASSGILRFLNFEPLSFISFFYRLVDF